MDFYDDLESQVTKIFKEAWSERDGQKVPESDDVQLGNDAVKLNATVLYTDLSGSTSLVDGHKAWFAAEIYKTFLYCAAKIVRKNGGTLTSYDGDRVMAVFIGKSKNTSAVKAALAINHAVAMIINPQLEKAYPKLTYRVTHITGIDSSTLLIARTGIRGSNDLVWVGRAANHAAKLSSSSFGSASVITSDVHDNMHDSVKFAEDGRTMWTREDWAEMGRTVYTSSWRWNS